MIPTALLLMPYFDFKIFVTKVFEPPLLNPVADQVYTVRQLFSSISLYVTVIVTFNQGFIGSEVLFENCLSERHLRLPRISLTKEFVCRDLGVKVTIVVNCCPDLDQNTFSEIKRKLLSNSKFRIPTHHFDPFLVRRNNTNNFSIQWINSKYNLTVDSKLLYYPVTLLSER
jgi:hypothetical protein